MLLLLGSAPLALLALWRTYGLIRNYITARRYNLPLIILPASFEDPIWGLLRPLFGWVEHLPFGMGDWYHYTDVGWPMTDGIKTISRLGESFVLVTPTRNQVITSFPPAADVMFKDLKNWVIPDPFSQFFTTYGQNVSSLNGADWQRHRKITGPAFSDQTMRYVWEESIERVVKDPRFLSTGKCTLAELRTDFNLLAMGVLATVGFNQETALTSVAPGHRLSLMESLEFVLQNVFVMVLFASLKAPDFILPPMLRRLKLCVAEFRLYMEEAILRHLRKETSSRPTLLSAMVNANEAEKGEKPTSAAKPSYLTDSELYGNLFIFNLAGFETTAGTFSFALPYLALHPETQEWVIEEVDKYFSSSSSSPDYQETYLKLVRCMAVMYETLRFAGPAPQMFRSPLMPTTVPLSSPNEKNNPGLPQSILIGPDTLVATNLYALHLSPRWGSDAQSFNPKRFIQIDPTTREETLIMPEDIGLSAKFIPWIQGARIWYVQVLLAPLRSTGPQAKKRDINIVPAKNSAKSNSWPWWRSY